MKPPVEHAFRSTPHSLPDDGHTLIVPLMPLPCVPVGQLTWDIRATKRVGRHRDVPLL